MPDHSLFRLRILPWCIALAMSGSYSSVWAEDDIQFDSRFLELKGDTKIGNDSNLLIVFYVQIMPDDFVMQLHRF